MKVLSSLEEIRVTFLPHPTRAIAHVYLNEAYGGPLTDLDDLFTDEKRTDLTDDVVNDLKRKIITTMIIPYATYTQDTTRITPLIFNATFRIDYATDSSARLSRQYLTKAMMSAVTAGKTFVELKISTQHFKFHPTADFSYLDWQYISDSPFDQLAAPEPALAPALALTKDDLVDALNSLKDAFKDSLTAALAPTNASASAPPPARSQPLSTVDLFNVNGLPDDVKARYLRKQENKVVLGDDVSKPFMSGYRWHMDGSDRLILPDGTLFLIQPGPLREKDLMREPVICHEATHSGIRHWYKGFGYTVMQFGYYIHPLWCYRKHHGGEWGFTCGNDPTDDLPQHLALRLAQWSSIIFRLLSKPEMFPKASNLSSVVSQCYGDGYKALKQILLPSHPVFHPQPATLITCYPMQNDLTLIQYHTLFLDYLQMYGFIMNVDLSLDQKNEMDVFISRARHGSFLNCVTSEERQMAKMAYLYTSCHIVATLEMKLMQADNSTAWEQTSRGLSDTTLTAASDLSTQSLIQDLGSLHVTEESYIEPYCEHMYIPHGRPS